MNASDRAFAPCPLPDCTRGGKHVVHGVGTDQWVMGETLQRAYDVVVRETKERAVSRDALIPVLAGSLSCMQREAAFVLDAVVTGAPGDPAVKHTDRAGVVEYRPRRGPMPRGASVEDDARAGAERRHRNLTEQIRDHVEQLARLRDRHGQPCIVRWSVNEPGLVEEVFYGGAPVGPGTWRALAGAGFPMGKRTEGAQTPRRTDGQVQDAEATAAREATGAEQASAGERPDALPHEAPQSSAPSLGALQGTADGGTPEGGAVGGPVVAENQHAEEQRIRDLAADLGLAVAARNAMARALEVERQDNRELRAAFDLLGLRVGDKPGDVARAWVWDREALEATVQAQRDHLAVLLAALGQWKRRKLARRPLAEGTLEDAERVLMAMADMQVFGMEGDGR